MRFVISAVACLAPLFGLPAWAETFTVPSKASSVIVYSAGASVTHDVAVTLPQGAHQIIMPNLPQGADLSALRVAAPGLKLGAIRYRDDLTPPQDTQDSPEIANAKAKIEGIENRIQGVEDRAERQGLAVDAATARINFLTALGDSDTLPADSSALRDLGQMIGAETLIARQAAFDAQLAVRDTLGQLKDLNKELMDARQALAALVPEPRNRPLLVIDVLAEAAVTDTPISVSFFADAYWQPTYDLRLSDTQPPRLLIERGAEVVQRSGENWDDVALTVSTSTPTSETDPWPLSPDLRRIFDDTKAGISSRAASAPRAMDAIVLEEATSMEANFQGLSVSYRYADPVDVASGADAVRLPFDSVTLDAELIARAIPLNHDKAFLIAKVTNTTPEPLLQSNAVLRFFDGGLVGSSALETIESGQEAEIGFGAIDGLQLTRKVLKRDSGDRGIITRSNEQSEEIEITLKNLTSRTWNVELRDRVPYSEQDDLEITFRAAPDPDVTGVDDLRGVLQWNIEMAPSNQATVSTSHRITWPDGQNLQ